MIQSSTVYFFLLIVTVISTDVDKQLLASENDVTMGRFSLLYTAPEAILGKEVWKQLQVQPPLCDTVVALPLMRLTVFSSGKCLETFTDITMILRNIIIGALTSDLFLIASES